MKNFPKSVKPLTVPVSENETLEQFRERWAKVDALSEKEKDILSSDFTYNSIFELSKNLALAETEVSEISRLVRGIVFGEIRHGHENDFLEKKIPRLRLEDVSKIRNVIRSILSQQVEFKNESDGLKKISLKIALVEYKKLGDQAVTSAPIKLRVFPEPVRPSIKNWVNDYHDHLGSGKHTTIERGNFLFHSDNGKKLSTFERRKLAEVLKSLDEDSVVSVDVENERMIFESNVQTQEMNPRPEQTATTKSNVQSQNFSRPVVSTPVSRPVAPRPNVQSVQNVSRGIDEISSGKTNVSLGEKRGFQVVSEEDYIQNLRKNINSASLSPASNQNVENGKTWNPAEAVKRRMEEESRNQSSLQSGSTEELSIENVAGGKVSFSSPQVLPVEKRDSDLGVRSGGDFSQTVQTANEANVKKSDSDNLMARIREMNKKSSPSSKPNIGFKITPSGISNGSASSNSADEGVSTRGNIVDLR